MPKFVVKLESNPDVWIAIWSGDPGRTHNFQTARLYKTARGAKIALGLARATGRAFLSAEIVEVPNV